MDADDIDDLEYDAMEPTDNDNDNDNTHSSPYLNHLVIPIKQIVRPLPPPMTFQTPVKVKKVNYDDILASMNLYVKDGQLHKINRSDGINLAAPKTRPTAYTPQPTQEELQKQRNARRKALHLNYLQQQRMRAQIAATKSKKIKFINDSRNIELDSHTSMQFFKMFGK
jgi:hypothetical protein